MRKLRVFLSAALIALILPVVAFSLPKIKNPLTDIKDKAQQRLDAEVASATGMTAMNRKLMFNTVYAQIFFTGGFGAGYYALEETQGSVWRFTTVDKEGNSASVDAERAFLKKLPDGSGWWYLSWKSGEDIWEFEALMDRDMLARKIRYYNEDVKRIQEAEFDYSKKEADPAEETTPPEEAPASDVDYSDLKAYSKGKETITVSGKKFECEKIEWPYYSDEDKATYTYTWWVDPSTAGGLIKFEWTKSGSKETARGELVSIKKGYKSKFKSF